MQEYIDTGDVVTLKTGSPPMTVESTTVGAATVVWFVKNGDAWIGPQREKFNKTCLKKVQ